MKNLCLFFLLSFNALSAQNINKNAASKPAMPNKPKAVAVRQTEKSLTNMTPEAIAKEMVRIVRLNDAPIGPAGSIEFMQALSQATNSNEDSALKHWFEKTQLATKLNLQGMNAMTVKVAIRGYYVSRRSLFPQGIASNQKLLEYESRFNKIIEKKNSLPTMVSRRQAERIADGKIDMSLLDEFSTQINLEQASIVFFDFFWAGSNWKKDSLSWANKRFESIASKYEAGAGLKWETAVRNSKISNPDFAIWSLLAIDALFINNVFQEKVFEKAFPIAERELLNGSSTSQQGSTLHNQKSEPHISKIDLSGKWTHIRSGGIGAAQSGTLELTRNKTCDDGRFTCFSGSSKIGGTEQAWKIGINGKDVVLTMDALTTCVGSINENGEIVAQCKFVQSDLGTIRISRIK